MTHTETAPAAAITPGVIRPRDLQPLTTETLRDTWTRGKLSLVLAIIAGVPAVFTVDGQTGHSVVGHAVRVGGRIDGGVGLTIASLTGIETNYWARGLGETITTLGALPDQLMGRNLRSAVVGLWADVRRAAVTAALNRMDADGVEIVTYGTAVVPDVDSVRRNRDGSWRVVVRVESTRDGEGRRTVISSDTYTVTV